MLLLSLSSRPIRAVLILADLTPITRLSVQPVSARACRIIRVIRTEVADRNASSVLSAAATRPALTSNALILARPAFAARTQNVPWLITCPSASVEPVSMGTRSRNVFQFCPVSMINNKAHYFAEGVIHKWRHTIPTLFFLFPFFYKIFYITYFKGMTSFWTTP